jgi:hypothetical protein
MFSTIEISKQKKEAVLVWRYGAVQWVVVKKALALQVHEVTRVEKYISGSPISKKSIQKKI